MLPTPPTDPLCDFESFVNRCVIFSSKCAVEDEVDAIERLKKADAAGEQL
jgi:hypothetical protein